MKVNFHRRIKIWFMPILQHKWQMKDVASVPQNETKSLNDIHCVQKKETKMLFVISPIKLRQFWRNFVSSFLNKFVIE